jgi:nicotinamidase-related amidase
VTVAIQVLRTVVCRTEFFRVVSSIASEVSLTACFRNANDFESAAMIWSRESLPLGQVIRSSPILLQGLGRSRPRFADAARALSLLHANRRDLLSRRETPERLHIERSWRWGIIDALKPQPQDLVLRKYRPDAFYGTILASILRWNGIRTVITTGVGVAVGGVPTVMTASNPRYQSVAVGDAFVSADDKRAMAVIDYLRAHAIVRSHEEIVEAWDRSTPRPAGVATNGPAKGDVLPGRAMHEAARYPSAGRNCSVRTAPRSSSMTCRMTRPTARRLRAASVRLQPRAGPGDSASRPARAARRARWRRARYPSAKHQCRR